MKIEKQQLIELLVVKTGLDQKSIKKQLEELIGRIRDAADRGKALEVKGFGLFYYSENGDLKFDPSEEFKTEVNFKYTGMEPIEVQEAHSGVDVEDIVTEDEPNTEISEEVEDADIWGVDDPAVEDKKEEVEAEEDDQKSVVDSETTEEDDLKTSEKAEVDESQTKEEEKKDEADESSSEKKKGSQFEDLIGDAFNTMEEEDVEKQHEDLDPFFDDEGPVEEPDKKEAPKEPVSESKVDDVIKKPEDNKSEKTESKKKKPTQYPRKPEKSYKKPAEEIQAIPINMIIIGISVLIVLVVGYFVVSDLTSNQLARTAPPVVEQQIERNGEAQQQAATESSEEEDESATPETTQEQNEGDQGQTETEPATDETEAAETAEAEQAQEETSVYGLTGEVNEALTAGYTIIVHSLRDESNARQAMQQFQDEGYRALVFSRDIPETGSVWRVGIGQFETLENAQEAAESLPEPFNENNFIQRIQ